MRRDSDLMCCIHDRFFHWCQHTPYSMEISKIAEEDFIGAINGQWVGLSSLGHMFIDVYEWHSLVHRKSYVVMIELLDVWWRFLSERVFVEWLMVN